MPDQRDRARRNIRGGIPAYWVVPRNRGQPQKRRAATSVLLAASPLVDGIGGRYFEDCNESPTVAQRPNDFSGGVAPYALDPDNAARLWEIGVVLTGLNE